MAFLFSSGGFWAVQLILLWLSLSGQNALAFVAPHGAMTRASAIFQKCHHRAAKEGVRSKVYLSGQLNDDDDSASPRNNHVAAGNRRTFLMELMSGPALMAGASLAQPQDANARGLMKFPCMQPLVNNYSFMHAGASLVEEEDGIWSTNPLFITNREYALSEAGRKVIEKQAEVLKRCKNIPTLVYHSLAANGIDTADIIQQQLQIGRERVLPEFTYLDQRAIGGWNDGALEDVQPAIWALDAFEASKEGVGGRPPPNEDGTPNEALADQFVRLRQFLSLLESRTSGENVLLVFPDSTGPALLSCMIAGIPLNEVHCLDYAPGELRMDITRESILEMYEKKKNDPEYEAALERGKEKLFALREQGKDVLSLKDQRVEQDRLEMEKEYRAKEQVRLNREAAENKLAKEKRKARLDKRKSEANNADGESNINSDPSSTADSSADSVDVSSSFLAAAGGLGIAGVAVTLGQGPSDDKKYDTSASVSSPVVGDSSETTAAATVPLDTNNEIDANASATNIPIMDKDFSEGNRVGHAAVGAQASHDKRPRGSDNAAHENDTITEELRELETGAKAMDKFLEREEEKNISTNIIDDSVHNVDELHKLEAAQNAMDEYLDTDDGYYDWLKVVADIRDEPDEEDGDDGILQVDAGAEILQHNTTMRY